MNYIYMSSQKIIYKIKYNLQGSGSDTVITKVEAIKKQLNDSWSTYFDLDKVSRTLIGIKEENGVTNDYAFKNGKEFGDDGKFKIVTQGPKNTLIYESIDDSFIKNNKNKYITYVIGKSDPLGSNLMDKFIEYFEINLDIKKNDISFLGRSRRFPEISFLIARRDEYVGEFNLEIVSIYFKEVPRYTIFNPQGGTLWFGQRPLREYVEKELDSEGGIVIPKDKFFKIFPHINVLDLKDKDSKGMIKLNHVFDNYQQYWWVIYNGEIKVRKALEGFRGWPDNDGK